MRTLILGTSRLEPTQLEVGVGDVATVWGGEITGMAEGLARVSLLADSKAALAAVKKAGRTGKARSSRWTRSGLEGRGW